MRRLTFKSLGSALLAVLTLAALPFGARAGLVTGEWDPPWGPPLPGLFWGVRGVFNVPNACTAQADGTYLTSSGACAGASTVSLHLRLFNSSATSNFFDNSNPTVSSAYDLQATAVALQGILANPSIDHTISQIKVAAGQVVGFQAGIFGTTSAPLWSQAWIPLAESQSQSFGVSLTLLGARPECLNCLGMGLTYGQMTGMDQFLVTYDTDPLTNALTPKLTDSNGNAAGVRLNDQGTVVGTFTVDPDDRFAPAAVNAVPEPGALALATLALGALGWSRRRRI